MTGVPRAVMLLLSSRALKVLSPICMLFVFGFGTGNSDGTDISEPSRRNGGGFGMVRGNGIGFGIEGVGAGCTALRGSCSAFTCGRGCVAVEALWLNASLDDEERVLFFEFVHLPSFMPHTFSSLQ